MTTINEIITIRNIMNGFSPSYYLDINAYVSFLGLSGVESDDIPWSKVVVYEGDVVTNEGEVIWET